MTANLRGRDRRRDGGSIKRRQKKSNNEDGKKRWNALKDCEIRKSNTGTFSCYGISFNTDFWIEIRMWSLYFPVPLLPVCCMLPTPPHSSSCSCSHPHTYASSSQPKASNLRTVPSTISMLPINYQLITQKKEGKKKNTVNQQVGCSTSTSLNVCLTSICRNESTDWWTSLAKQEHNMWDQ